MNFFKTIPNKTYFYGGWGLIGIGIFEIFMVVFYVNDFKKLAGSNLGGIMIVWIMCVLLIFLFGNSFIESGLKEQKK